MKIRPMTMADADFMLELKNDATTRLFTLGTGEVIKREDHIKYLEQNIHDFQIIEEGENQVHTIGAARIQDNEISIWIAPKYRNCGWGAQAIKRLRKHNMTAKILFSNLASIRAFIHSEFLPVECVSQPVHHYIFKYTAKAYAP
jgi:hypothetical protein